MSAEESGKSNAKKRKLEESAESTEPAKKKRRESSDKEPEKPMTRCEFMEHAEDQKGMVGDIEIVAKKKNFSSSSVGYMTSSLAVIKLNEDKKVAVRIGVNVTVKGSKQWDDGEENEDDDLEQEKEKKKKTKQETEKGDILTKAELLSLAEPLKLKLFGKEIECKPRKFTSGNVGWCGMCGKIEWTVNEKQLKMRLMANIICIGSAKWKEE